MNQVETGVAASSHVGERLHLLVLRAPALAAASRPGQFVMVRCGDLTLRRPLSIHAASDDHIALLFNIVGRGTDALSTAHTGDTVSVTGPLGKGFTLPEPSDKVLLIAGGVGIAPLWFLASRLETAADAVLVYGTRTAPERYIMPAVLVDLVPDVGRVDRLRRVDVTDDGTCGTRSDACAAMIPYLSWADRVYVCGPLPMCIAADAFVSSGVIRAPGADRLLDAEVSLETRMACGVGACYSCSIETRGGRRKVCVDGPVFRWGDVLWPELAT